MRVITGIARGRKLVTLEGEEVVRPTTDRVKEAMFSIIQFDIPGKSVLDLFAGSGQLGIEALSRGAEKAVFVDKSAEAFSVVKQNLKTCGLSDKATVINSDSFGFLRSTAEKFDIILIDPPYSRQMAETALSLVDGVLKDGGIVMCETDYREDLPEEVGDIKKFKEYKYSKTKLTTYKKEFGGVFLKTVICPGSFDPVTMGHLDIIRRSAKMFDKVIVVVMTNYHKKNNYAFTSEERVELLKRCTADMPNVDVDRYDGLLADYARRKEAVAIVKGLRAVSDFEYEFQQALTNKKLNNELETVFITTRAENMYLSSSVVKQVCELGGDISTFVPAEIREDIIKRIKK